ncbi:phosphonate ABC transporter, permease protein PhnE [Halonotius aquaticus]|uniref:Phosphonate ABC transporter, permease protein PhnE n=1 Tax=Halonotius aquaticus TaxID=2216978 RepID=A0A3A6PVN0_9EURY|nr:phosphonate ABC transporter, permease protein PhnE [Halonotius aquaticus]RJX43689.1 phosphonate ABC transporter, permease protein PhnE [Halonotius aquaticus]
MSTEQPSWERFDRRRRLGRFIAVLTAAVVVIASWQFMDIGVVDPNTVPREIADLLTRMYPPDVAYTPQIIGPLIETIHIAALGTVGALVLSIPVALLAAENTTPNAATFWLGKLIVTVSRSVNTIIWALIFVVTFGSGPLAGAVAIAFRSVGFLGKLLGEEIEEIDFGQVEAVRATGASSLQLLLYGILPQVKPALIGLAIYRWDINIRDSTVLGFVGAGGIGVQLFQSVNAFAWQSTAMILLIILGVVVVTEGLSAYTRGLVR